MIVFEEKNEASMARWNSSLSRNASFFASSLHLILPGSKVPEIDKSSMDSHLPHLPNEEVCDEIFTIKNE